MRRAAITIFFLALILSGVPTFYHPSMLNAQSPISWTTV